MKWLGIQTTANAGSVKPQGMNSTPGEHSPFPSTTPAGGRPISEPLSQADLPIRIGKASRRGRGGVFDLAMGVGRGKRLDPIPFQGGGSVACAPRQVQGSPHPRRQTAPSLPSSLPSFPFALVYAPFAVGKNLASTPNQDWTRSAIAGYRIE